MNDTNQPQIATATAYVYKASKNGDVNGLEYDKDGNIKNELVRVQTFSELPVEKVEE